MILACRQSFCGKNPVKGQSKTNDHVDRGIVRGLFFLVQIDNKNKLGALIQNRLALPLDNGDQSMRAVLDDIHPTAPGPYINPFLTVFAALLVSFEGEWPDKTF